MQDEFAAIAASEPEGDFPAEISAARLLIRLHLANAFADAVALSLSEGGGDRQEQLGQAIAGDVPAEVEQMEFDATLLQVFDDLERVKGRAEQAIELGCDDNIAPLQLGEQRAAYRALLDGDGTD